jgi:hypothetical protein
MSSLVSKIRQYIFLLRRNWRKALLSHTRPRADGLSRKSAKFSAYLSIYNDWDILAPALASVADYVDELVVVDGAYDWMSPYLTATGSDPTRSNAAVYAAIAKAGIPYRIINRTWRDESEKRCAGFEACSHRYIFRLDADEVLFFDDRALEAFLGSGCAVADMQMPLYLSPGRIVCPSKFGGRLPRIPHQCCLFDSQRISAQAHLKYLWLVLPGQSDRANDTRVFPTFEHAIAFCAHLSNWRTANTAVNRGAFYMLNWMRHHGVSILPELSETQTLDFRELFARIPAATFRAALLRGQIPIGTFCLAPNEVICRSPLSESKEGLFTYLYTQFLSQLEAQNHQASKTGQALIFGQPLFFDITTASARAALSGNGVVMIETSVPMHTVLVRRHLVFDALPAFEVEDLPLTIHPTGFSFALPPEHARHHQLLRQTLELVGYQGSEGGFCEFRVISAARPCSSIAPQANALGTAVPAG